MTIRDEIYEMMQRAPVPKARKHAHHRFVSLYAARFFAVLQTVLGVLCMVFTEQIHSLFPYILGTLMVFTGFCDVCRGVVTQEFRNRDTKLTSHGIVTAILGCVILYHHRNADSIIGAIWGVIGLIKGTETLNLAIYSLAAKEPFIGELGHGAIELLLGIFLLKDPLSAVEHHLFILGIELVALGIQTIVETKKMMKSENTADGGTSCRKV